MRADDIVQKARDAAGLNDFDNESFREGLEVAVAAAGAQPLRAEDGDAWLEETFVRLLMERLKLADYARRYPDVRDQLIERPIFILGLPRTGATIASNLLGGDRQYRSILRWEVPNAAEDYSAETLFSNPLLKALQDRDWELLKEDKSHAAIHYEMPEGPTECGRVLAGDFKAARLEAAMASASYSRWLLNADLRSAYEYHALFLRVLQSKAPGKWSLKSPSHALGIRHILQMYPDARIIWTHRDPYRAAASYMSTVAVAQKISLSSPDLAHIAATVPLVLREHVARPMRVIDEGEGARFYHLHYSALTTDPLTEMRKLYDWLGDDLSRETVHAMRNWLFIFQKGNFGDHVYSLEQFGLSEKDLTPHFEDYMKRFEIEREIPA